MGPRCRTARAIRQGRHSQRAEHPTPTERCSRRQPSGGRTNQKLSQARLCSNPAQNHQASRSVSGTARPQKLSGTLTQRWASGITKHSPDTEPRPRLANVTEGSVLCWGPSDLRPAPRLVGCSTAPLRSQPRVFPAPVGARVALSWDSQLTWAVQASHPGPRQGHRAQLVQELGTASSRPQVAVPCARKSASNRMGVSYGSCAHDGQCVCQLGVAVACACWCVFVVLLCLQCCALECICGVPCVCGVVRLCICGAACWYVFVVRCVWCVLACTCGTVHICVLCASVMLHTDVYLWCCVYL